MRAHLGYKKVSLIELVGLWARGKLHSPEVQRSRIVEGVLYDPLCVV